MATLKHLISESFELLTRLVIAIGVVMVFYTLMEAAVFNKIWPARPDPDINQIIIRECLKVEGIPILVNGQITKCSFNCTY